MVPSFMFLPQLQFSDAFPAGGYERRLRHVGVNARRAWVLSCELQALYSATRRREKGGAEHAGGECGHWFGSPEGNPVSAYMM